jgi:hypothetical protein
MYKTQNENLKKAREFSNYSVLSERKNKNKTESPRK